MKSTFAIFQHKTLFLSAITIGWLEVAALPNPNLIVILFGVMIVDFITGLIKSWKKGESTSKVGFVKSVTKIGVYTGAIMGVWLLANLLAQLYLQSTVDYTLFVNWTIGFLSFIELYSIFENIYETDPESKVSKKFVKPILKFLKGRIDNNPFTNPNNKDNGQ